MLQQTQVSRVEAYYHRFLDRYPTIEALAAAPAGWCGRAGRDWDITGGRPTCIGWRRRWCGITAGVIPADRPSCAASGRRPLHRGGGRELCLRAVAPGSGYQCGPGASARLSPPHVGQGTRPAESGAPPSGMLPAGARLPGRSIRRSWSWERWSVRPRVARCGVCPVRRPARQDRNAWSSRSIAPGEQRHQPESPRDRRHDPLPRAQLVEVPARFTGGIEPAELGRGRKRDEQREQGGDDTRALHQHQPDAESGQIAAR